MKRRFGFAVLAALLAIVIGGCAVPPAGERAGLAKIEHIVVIFAENRSFDNLYGLFPGANGIANATPAQYTQVDRDGKPLAAGTYQVRLTADEAKPDATGTSQKLERWVEFVQKGDVKGREVVSIVPQTEQKLVQKDAPPAAGGSKVQMLKGGDYLRVWINKAGNYYLIHLPV